MSTDTSPNHLDPGPKFSFVNCQMNYKSTESICLPSEKSLSAHKYILETMRLNISVIARETSESLSNGFIKKIKLTITLPD